MKATIKQWRGLRGMTQPELGNAIGKNGNTVLNWEKGYTTPSAKDMDALRRALKLSASDTIVLP